MEESYKKVSFQEAKHIIDTEPNCVILDVRDEDEYITGNAENAVLFPVDTIDEDTAEEKIPTPDTPMRSRKQLSSFLFTARAAAAALWRR